MLAALQPLPSLLAGKVSGATAGAYTALAQLCTTAAAAAAATAAATTTAATAAAHGVLRALVGAASPREGTAAADAMAAHAAGNPHHPRAPNLNPNSCP